MRSSFVTALLCAALTACSSDPAAPTDAGASDVTDATDAGSDAGSGADATDGSADVDAGPPRFPWPEPDAFGPLTGPGVGPVTFRPEQLYVHCAPLTGSPEFDHWQHHNLVVMYDGLLLMPWAPEYSGARATPTGARDSQGITLFDMSNPCVPVVVGMGHNTTMRESHSVGFSQIGGRWAVVNHLTDAITGGIEFWDLSDPAAPAHVSSLALPGFFYPDAYARVTLSVFWQAPYVYVAGADNGIYIVDATDPMNPVLVNQYRFDPVLRTGQVHAIGDLLITTAAEGARTAMLDISDPANPQPIPGGEFEATDGSGEPRDAYFSNTNNGYIWYARKEDGGGLIAYDIHDPTQPTLAASYRSDGNGGYVFVKDNLAYVGESRLARIYDITDLANIVQVAELDLPGDLDTMTPIGNVVVLSVDDEAEEEGGSVVAPVSTDPDSTAPRVTWVWPADGATNLAPTSRIGLTFNEMVEPLSAFEGSVRMWRSDLEPEVGRIDGYISTQEAIVNFWPVEPLEAGRQYTIEVPAGGIVDYSGNAVVEAFRATFTVAGDVVEP